MEAMSEAPRSWKAQAMEAREKEKTLSWIQKNIKNLYMAIKDLSDADAGREEKEAKLKEEQESLTREYLRVASEIKRPDYSGMSEAERAEEAERLKQEAMEEVRRLEMEGDHDGSLYKQCQARIMDFDPKQGGMYYNRMSALPTFDHDEEC